MMFTISDGDFVVTIDSVGAQMISVKTNGKERLWQNENGSWTGHAPVLFPACGRTKTLVDGIEYPLPMHGFARHEEFVGEQTDAKTVKFTLCSNADTKAMYPFDWVFVITYHAEGNKLTVTHFVENRGKKVMYFSLGGHESFAIDHEFADYELRFDHTESFVTSLHDDKGLLTGKKLQLAPEGTVLPLPERFMSCGTTVILQNIPSRSVELCCKTGEALARVTFDGFANLLLWHPDGSNMICIEPWLNAPDFADDGPTELSSKDGFVALGGGQNKKYVRTVTYM